MGADIEGAAMAAALAGSSPASVAPDARSSLSPPTPSPARGRVAAGSTK